jgi:alanine dehydrogenase
VVGAVLLPGARAPRLVTEKMIKQMEPGSVIVDVSIDQGGCVEGARATYHDNPTYDLHGVTAYMVANMPGAVPRTSTYALTNATIKYVVLLADNGLEKATKQVPHLVSGINTYKGAVPHAAVAEALGITHTPFHA